MKSPEERFWSRVDKSQSCWLWRGSRDTGGYGMFSMNRQRWAAHRASYHFSYGDIPGGMDVLHSCDVRHCVNPSHLRPGTHLENMRDMEERGRAVRNRGSRNGLAKLSEADVVAMRYARAMAGVRLVDIAAAMGVSLSVVGNICTRTTWRHV